MYVDILKRFVYYIFAAEFNKTQCNSGILETDQNV